MNTVFFKDGYDTMHNAGKAQLLQGGMTTFSGVTEAMKQDLIVAIRPHSGVGTTYLLDELAALESSGLSFFLANRDFPIHVTVQVSIGGLAAEEILSADRGQVTELTFNRLLLDSGGNIKLANEGVPREIAEWRGWASQVMTECGGQPKPLPILHSTLARIMGPKVPNSDAAARLVALVEDWNNRLQSEPLRFVHGHTYVGTVYDLLTL